jgi:hypothetical protein
MQDIKILSEYLKGREQLGDQGIHRSIIFKWILLKWGMSVVFIQMAQER